ncbi:hypothetical protein HDU87_000248 [Geranomyces variabilis]|uniref:Uncharacterized protein n=1 Tax=Geranomyces variabilis TaxID=109894 RepID=A0AAD5XW72_9FUNG|nr:hypothetical protein HDU87_000248 [Geranomyces variabilis]
MPAHKRAEELRSEGETLHLAFSNLDVVPSSVLNSRNLVNLNLSNNNIAALPVEFCALKSLRILHLSENILEVLPTNFNQIYLLEILSLGGNRLTSSNLDRAGLDKLGQLTRLDLGRNLLTNIPASLCEIDTLVHLALGGNEIEDIPDEIAKLQQLVGIAQNKLRTVNRALGKIRTLKGISLADNPLIDQKAELVELSGVLSVIHAMINTRTDANGTSEAAIKDSVPEDELGASFPPAAVQATYPEQVHGPHAITTLPDPVFPIPDRFSLTSADSHSCALSPISESDRSTLVGSTPSDAVLPASGEGRDSTISVSATGTTAVAGTTESPKFSPLRTDISNFVIGPASAASAGSSDGGSVFSLGYYGVATNTPVGAAVGTPMSEQPNGGGRPTSGLAEGDGSADSSKPQAPAT